MKYIPVNTPGDGTCLFHATVMGIYYKLSDNARTLRKRDIITMGRQLRKEVLDYMLQHKKRYQNMLNNNSTTYTNNNKFYNIEDHVKHMRNHKIYAAIIEVDALRRFVYETYKLRIQIFMTRNLKKIYNSNKDFIETLNTYSNRPNVITLVLHKQHYTLVLPIPSETKNVSFAY